MFDLFAGMTPEEYAKAEERTSMLTWWPVIFDKAITLFDDYDVALPRTTVIELPGDIRGGLYALLGEGGPEPAKESVEGARAKLKEAVNKYGPPAFLRTDMTSNKHSWARTCYVADAEKAWGQFLEIVCFGICMMPELAVNAIIVREYLTLDGRFTAFAGMPIGPEIRVMVRDGKSEWAFPYWPIEAFERDKSLPENWRDQLQQLNGEAMTDENRLKRAAEYVGSLLPGYWSVDFALEKNSGWYLIDMADGRRSWTPKKESD